MAFVSASTGKVVTPPYPKGSKVPREVVEKQKRTRQFNMAIKSVVYEELKRQLLEGEDTKAYYQQFIKKYLAKAKADPDSRAAQTVADTIFQREILAMLDEQHEKELANDREFMEYKMMKSFFKEQREVIYETNHSKHILVCCSRRAGKTDLASGSIIAAAMKRENSRIIYMNLTFTNAINQIWDNIIERSERAGFMIKSSSSADGHIQWINGSSLRIVGNSNNAEADKLRGEQKVSLVVIDEFFHQRNMEYAINEVIEPLMLDLTDSTILCMGTPPRVPKTYGERCWTTEKMWKKFHWTARDNPYIPQFDEFLDMLCRNKGITRDAPFIQREYEGVIGAYDKEAMVFKGYRTYTEIQSFVPTHVAIGLDIGFEDYNAIAALAYDDSGRCYVIEERKFNRAAVSEIVRQVEEVYSRSKTFLLERNPDADLSNVAIYSDTNNKELVYELYQMRHLPAYCCYKYDKAMAISQLAEWCRTGKIQIRPDQHLSDEFQMILYKRDEDDNILTEIDEALYHPDIMMALLYATRQMWYDTGNELGGQAKEDWS